MYAKEKILSYLLLDNILNIKELQIPKPDKEKIHELIEYQQIFDLKIEIIVSKIIEKVQNETEEFTNELLETNSEINDDKKEIIWPKTLENIILRVRSNIGNKTKQIWLIFETAIEKVIQLQKKETKRKKRKKQSWKAKKK